MKRFFLTAFKLLAFVIFGVSLVFFTGVLWPLHVPKPNERPDRLLINDVTLVDLESGQIKQKQDILIERGEIISVAANLDTDGAQVLEASGRFAIPGLFDMHAHSIKMSPSITHPMFVAAGVTAIRDMGGCIGIEDAWVACLEDKRAWDQGVREGSMIGPRYDQVTSLAINGGSEIPDSLDRNLGAATAAGARARVEYDSVRGVDFLKTYSMLPAEGYFALAESAQERGMYLAGHLPLAVSGLEAAAAGQRSIEHAFLFIWDCYPGMAELRSETDLRRIFTNELRLKMIKEHDGQLCSELHRQMISTGMAFVPTHTTRKLDAFAIDENFRNDLRLRYVPAPLRTLWLQDANNMAAKAGEGGQKSYQAFYQFGIEQTGIAHRAGVIVMAGSDAPDSFAFPGFGIHDELDHLIMAGFTPLDALRSATVEPTRFLGLEETAGVIRIGARADIVLLNQNPLADIRAVRDIDAVVLAGTVYDRTDLDELLDGVERSSAHWSMWPKFIWQLLRSPIMRKQFAD